MDSTSSYTPLKAELSHDGGLVAVAVPDRRIIQVYQTENGLLQTTLTVRGGASLSSSGVGNTAFDKVLFCGNNYVVAMTLRKEGANSEVLVWDLSRGGVVAHSITTTSSNPKLYLDAACSKEHFYLLVAVSSSNSRRSSAMHGRSLDWRLAMVHPSAQSTVFQQQYQKYNQETECPQHARIRICRLLPFWLLEVMVQFPSRYRRHFSPAAGVSSVFQNRFPRDLSPTANVNSLLGRL